MSDTDMLHNTAIVLKSGAFSWEIPTPRSFINVSINIEDDSHIKTAIDLLCVEFYFGEQREEGSVLAHVKRVTDLALIIWEGNNANYKLSSNTVVYALSMFHDVNERYVFTDLGLEQFESAMRYFVSQTFVQDTMILERTDKMSRVEYIGNLLKHGSSDVLLVKMSDLLDRINTSKNGYKINRAKLEYLEISKIYNIIKRTV